MTDPRIPHGAPGPDDADGLGLDSLTDGARPTTRQWTTISTTATRRRHRRTWVLTAAAAVLLISVGAALMLDRPDDSVSISAGGLPAGAERYVIPPAGATDVNIQWTGPSYAMTYTTAGQTWVLRGYAAGDPIVPGTSPPTELLRQYADQIGAQTIPAPLLGTVYAFCSGVSVSSSSGGGPAGTTPDTVITEEIGPMTANWAMGSSVAILMPAREDRSPCRTSDGPDGTLSAGVLELRVVDTAGFQRYLAGDVDGGSPVTTIREEGGVQAPPTTATAPEEPPVDRGTAEEQIAAAVAAWDQQNADGSYPNLEEGTGKAAEYAEMFDTAAKQSGADQAADRSGNTASLSSVRFVTPERATITMALGAVLPTGTYTFSQEGEAVLQGGRWVVTYRTVTLTLGRACLPPGGYDGC